METARPEPEIEQEKDPVQEKIASMEAKLQKYEEQNRMLNENILKMATAQQVQPNPINDVPEIKLPEKIPDPIDDPTAYSEYIDLKQEKRLREVQTKMEQKYQEKLQAQEDQTKYERLKLRFQEKYPELAKKNFDFVEHVAVKKIKEAAANRLDVNQYVYGNLDKFIDEVAHSANDQLGLGELSEDGRTQGLSAGGTSVKPKPKPKSKEKGFNEQFKEIRNATPGIWNPNYPVT